MMFLKEKGSKLIQFFRTVSAPLPKESDFPEGEWAKICEEASSLVEGLPGLDYQVALLATIRARNNDKLLGIRTDNQ